MTAQLREGLCAYHTFSIAVYDEGGHCDQLVDLIRKDDYFSEAGIFFRRKADDLLRLIGRDQDIVAVVVLWSSPNANGLLEMVSGLRQRQVNQFAPILVRSLAPLPAQARQRLKASGIYGPYCREGFDAAALLEDMLFALDVMHEMQALAALSTFAEEQAGVASLPELAMASLAFLHRNGIGVQGGVFCFLRPTPHSEWRVLAGTGRFGVTESGVLDEIDASVGALIEREGAAQGVRLDAGSVMLRFATPEGYRLCLYLAQKNPLMPWHRDLVEVFCKRLATAVDEVVLKRRLQRLNHAMIATLATVAEYKDVDTGQHVTRVARIASEVARILADRGVVAADDAAALVQHIGHASILHDVGKIGIPDRILLKPGSLDAEELRIVQSHTALGHEMLLKTAIVSDAPELMKLAADVARSHHERYDGKGYPDGLAGDAIPLAARIVAVVDVFDALTSERPYKAPWAEEEAIDFICEHAGTHFDPKVIEAFLTIKECRSNGVGITWSPSFAVGHGDIDRDHERLFGMLNLIWSLTETGNRETVEMVLDDLLHYTMVHFRREEAYMASVGYQDYAAHRAAHESFSRHIESLRWEYLHGVRRKIRGELLTYLTEWLMNHISHADRKFSGFFKERQAA